MSCKNSEMIHQTQAAVKSSHDLANEIYFPDGPTHLLLQCHVLLTKTLPSTFPTQMCRIQALWCKFTKF